MISWCKSLRQKRSLAQLFQTNCGPPVCLIGVSFVIHDDVIKWKHFPRYWPFVRGIYRSLVNSPHKGQGRGALMFSLVWAWTNDYLNNRDAGDLRGHSAHYNVIVIYHCTCNGIEIMSLTTNYTDMSVSDTHHWKMYVDMICRHYYIYCRENIMMHGVIVGNDAITHMSVDQSNCCLNDYEDMTYQIECSCGLMKYKSVLKDIASSWVGRFNIIMSSFR